MSHAHPSHPKSFRTELEVRGYELDSFGHVNNAVFLNYLEVARWKMLAEEGVSLEAIRKFDRWPVIAAIDIQYRKPAFFGDRLEVETRLAEYGRSSMRIEQTIRRGESVIAEAKVRSVIVDGKGKPAELPAELAEKWRRLAGRKE
jgi:YbgC/YbaW family acyl-CoA thioester hydrolase